MGRPLEGHKSNSPGLSASVGGTSHENQEYSQDLGLVRSPHYKPYPLRIQGTGNAKSQHSFEAVTGPVGKSCKEGCQ